MGRDALSIAYLQMETWSITRSQVPSDCQRATSAVTLPSGRTIEVRARFPLIKAVF
jgi:hypothetical protein